MHQGGVKVYSRQTSQVRTSFNANNDSDVEGVAYDGVNKRLYYTNTTHILSINRDGSDGQAILTEHDCKI